MSLYKLDYLHETEQWFIEYSSNEGMTWNDSGERPFNLNNAHVLKYGCQERHPDYDWRIVGKYRRDETRVYE